MRGSTKNNKNVRKTIEVDEYDSEYLQPSSGDSTESSDFETNASMSLFISLLYIKLPF